MSFNLGSVVPLSITITDSTGALANAGSATVTISLPDGTTATSGAIAPTSTGVYDYDYPTVQAGRHAVRWVATAPNASAYTDMFEVLPADPGLIVSLADLKGQVNIPVTNTDSDDELLEFGRAVTGICEDHVGAIVRTTHTQTVSGGLGQILLAHTPVLSVVSVTEGGSVLDPAGYEIKPASGVLSRRSGDAAIHFQGGIGAVTVVYTAGSTSTPPNTRLAALIIFQHLWETQRPAGRGPFTQGSDDYDPRYAYSIPRRALELLGEPVGGIA